MNDFFLLTISIVWGQLSTQFFFNGWISFLGLIYCIIGLVRKQHKARAIMPVAFSRFTQIAFFATLLAAGFYVLYSYLPMGQTTTETLVYLISATVRMGFILPGAGRAIDKVMSDIDNI